MLTDESQQSVQDSHGPRNRGGWRVPVAYGRITQQEQAADQNAIGKFAWPDAEQSALSHAQLKLNNCFVLGFFDTLRHTFKKVSHKSKVEVGAEI